MLRQLTLCVAALASFASTAPSTNAELIDRALSPYAPYSASCPGTPLVRPATSLGSDEAKYVSARKTKADAGLASWLKKHKGISTSNLPTVGFTSSGGGYRALLCTAGVVQAFDGRDSVVSTSGLYQGLVYQSGLSGGSWFLSSLASNNWPTVSSLRDNLWEQAFQNSIIVPSNLLSVSGLTEYVAVTSDLVAKQAAGYNVTVVDAWGRLLSYQFLYGSDGGVNDRLSGLTALSNFTSHNVPYPVITITEDFPEKGIYYPTISGPIWEFHPYEYGSWDKGVSAMASTKYMGSNIANGKPVKKSSCVQNYDNIGYVFGTSSDVFNGASSAITPSNNTLDLAGVLEGIVAKVHSPALNDQFGLYPNPFYQYQRSSLVKSEKTLTLSDGGEALQNNPIWPFIQPERKIDVLIVNDNSADTSDNFPNGTEIRTTYLQAQAQGLPKMPFIPDVSTFVSQGLNKRATFFGCNETGTTFIVYLPNVNYTFPSNEPTIKIQYSVAETDGMIANGMEIATQNGQKGWGFCLACAIKNGDGASLPDTCNACFDKYCYRQ